MKKERKKSLRKIGKTKNDKLFERHFCKTTLNKSFFE